MSSFDGRTYFFLFATANGKRKVSFGRTAEQALESLRDRLTEEEMKTINPGDVICCKQEEFRKYLGVLG